MGELLDEKAQPGNRDALARIEAYLEPWSPFRGGVSVASRNGRHLFLQDIRDLVKAVRDA